MASYSRKAPTETKCIFKLATVKKPPIQNAKAISNNNNSSINNNNNNNPSVAKSTTTSNNFIPKINTTFNFPKKETPIASSTTSQIDVATTTTPVLKPLVTVIKRPNLFRKPSPPSCSSSASPHSSPEKDQSSSFAYYHTTRKTSVQEQEQDQQASDNLNLYQSPADKSPSSSSSSSSSVNQTVKNDAECELLSKIPKIYKVGEKSSSTIDRENDDKENESYGSILSTYQPRQQQSTRQNNDELDCQTKNKDYLGSASSYTGGRDDYNNRIQNVLDKTVTRCRAKSVVSLLTEQKQQVTDYEAESQRKIHRMKEIVKQMEDLGQELKLLLQD